MKSRKRGEAFWGLVALSPGDALRLCSQVNEVERVHGQEVRCWLMRMEPAASYLDIGEAWQAVLLLVWLRGWQFNSDGSRFLVLCKLARRCLKWERSKFRKRCERRCLFTDMEDGDRPTRFGRMVEALHLVQQVSEFENAGWVGAALESLPPRVREVVLLTTVCGWNREEVAAELCLKPASVKSYGKQGRKALRNRLTQVAA